MFDITLIAMGKLKEKFYLSAASEYAKRLGGYCRFTLLELPEVRLPENPSPAEISAGLEKEAELIFSKVLRVHPGGKSAFQRGLRPDSGSRQEFRKRKRLLSHRLLLWHGSQGQAKSGFEAFHGPHDLPPPSGPDHGFGAAVPGRGHPGRVEISQIESNPKQTKEKLFFFGSLRIFCIGKACVSFSGECVYF